MKKAFTLVELIVVVTILAILGAIGFVSYNGYLSGVRDTNRTSQLTSLHDGLELYRTRKDLPDPDLKVEIKNGTEILGYQGYAGSGVLNTIEFVKGGKDPKDNGYFTYYLDSSKREFQLMSYLEDQENTTYLLGMLLPKVSAAVNYMSRYPVVYGKKLGILVDNTTNAPIQETLTGTLNLGSGSGATTTYKAYFKNDNVVTSSGTALVTKIKDNRTAVASSGSGSSSDTFVVGSVTFYKTDTFNQDGFDWYKTNISNWSSIKISNFMDSCESMGKKLVYNYGSAGGRWYNGPSGSQYCTASWNCIFKTNSQKNRLAFASSTNNSGGPGYLYGINYGLQGQTSTSYLTMSECPGLNRQCDTSGLNQVFPSINYTPSSPEAYIPCK